MRLSLRPNSQAGASGASASATTAMQRQAIESAVRQHASFVERRLDAPRRALHQPPPRAVLERTLRRAAGEGSVDAVTALVQAGVDPAVTGHRGDSALDRAAALLVMKPEMMQALLSRRVEDAVASGDADTLDAALHEVAALGAPAHVAPLLEAGADPASRVDGQTPLHRIAHAAQVDPAGTIQLRPAGMARALVQAGADPGATNADGNRPWDLLQGAATDELGMWAPYRALQQALGESLPSRFDRLQPSVVANIARHLDAGDEARLAQSFSGAALRMAERAPARRALDWLDRLAESYADSDWLPMDAQRLAAEVASAFIDLPLEQLDGPLRKLSALVVRVSDGLPLRASLMVGAALLAAVNRLPEGRTLDQPMVGRALEAVHDSLAEDIGRQAFSATGAFPADLAGSFVRAVGRLASPSSQLLDARDAMVRQLANTVSDTVAGPSRTQDA